MPGALHSGIVHGDGVPFWPANQVSCPPSVAGSRGRAWKAKAVRSRVGVVSSWFFCGSLLAFGGLLIPEQARFLGLYQEFSTSVSASVTPAEAGHLRSSPGSIPTSRPRGLAERFLNAALSSPITWELEAEERYFSGVALEGADECLSASGGPEETRGATGPGLAVMPGRQSSGAAGVVPGPGLFPRMVTHTARVGRAGDHNGFRDALDYFSVRQGYVGRWQDTNTPSCLALSVLPTPAFFPFVFDRLFPSSIRLAITQAALILSGRLSSARFETLQAREFTQEGMPC